MISRKWLTARDEEESKRSIVRGWGGKGGKEDAQGDVTKSDISKSPLPVSEDFPGL